jgi:hypothetical protein
MHRFGITFLRVQTRVCDFYSSTFMHTRVSRMIFRLLAGDVSLSGKACTVQADSGLSVHFARERPFLPLQHAAPPSGTSCGAKCTISLRAPRASSWCGRASEQGELRGPTTAPIGFPHTKLVVAAPLPPSRRA